MIHHVEKSSKRTLTADYCLLCALLLLYLLIYLQTNMEPSAPTGVIFQAKKICVVCLAVPQLWHVPLKSLINNA